MAKDSYRNPRLDIIYKYQQSAQSLSKISDELCYRNNPNSLFRKYKELVTWFANTNQGKKYLRIDEIAEPISLFLPNGYHRILGKDKYQLTVYSRAIFSKKLYPALALIDSLLPYLSSPEETKQLFLFKLGLGKLPFARMPQIASRIFLTSFGPIYPDPNPESTTVDGMAYRDGVDESFASIRAGAGTGFFDDRPSEAVPRLNASGITNQYNFNSRGFFLFDTSSLPDAAVISDSSISIYSTDKGSGVGTPAHHIASSTPGSNTALAASDYVNRGTTTFGNITYANWSIVGYNEIVLNASGIANISLTGISKFSSQSDWDINNNFTGTWVSSAQSYFGTLFADNGGTTQDPKITGNYTTTSTSTSTSTSTTSTSSSTSSSTSTSTSTTISLTTSTSTTSTSSSTTSTSTTSTSSSTTTSTSTSSSTSTTSTSSSTTMPLSISVDAG